MLALYIILGILGGLVLLAVLLILGTLILIYYHPSVFIHKFMRKPVTKEEVIRSLKYPENFDAYERKVNVIPDLVYSDLPNSTFDLYLPKDCKEKVPLIIWVHGGAFCAGEKEGTYALNVMIASEGIAVASLNYELALENNFKGMAKQIEAFVKYLYSENDENLAKLNLNKLIFAGDSAGGHIVLSYVMSQTNEEYSKLIGIERKHDKEIKGTLLLCNPYDLVSISKVKNNKLKYLVNAFGRKYFCSSKRKKDGSGRLGTYYEFVNANFVPSYLTDGNTGSFEVQARKFEKALNDNNIKNETFFFEKTKKVNHEYNFELDTEEAMMNFYKMMNFIKEIVR